jgi:hypothetical protein
MQHAIVEAQARITAVAKDAFAGFDLVSDWLVALSVNAGVHLHVIPLPHEAAAPHV